MTEVKLVTEGGKVKGFSCECGASHLFTSYVYAHWTLRLTCTCDCGRTYTIKAGRVRLPIARKRKQRNEP